jgi:hypothetical protein
MEGIIVSYINCYCIDPDLFPELLTELRIATSDEEMSLDKTEYSMDLFDSLRLSMEYIVY